MNHSWGDLLEKDSLFLEILYVRIKQQTSDCVYFLGGPWWGVGPTTNGTPARHQLIDTRDQINKKYWSFGIIHFQHGFVV